MKTLAQRTIDECEAVIEHGLGTFVEVGLALMEIRDRRLYRAEFRNFEEYCRDRWQWGRSYANKVIAATEVVGILEAQVGTKVPKSETQARELAPLKAQPEKMAEAWEEAVKESDGKPTAKAVQNAVNKMTNVHYCRFRDCGLSFSHPVKHCLKCAGHYTGYIHVCQSKVEPPVEVEPVEVEVIDVCPTCGQVIPAAVAS